jgi:tetratricopeptide (TPR) repeat protein
MPYNKEKMSKRFNEATVLLNNLNYDGAVEAFSAIIDEVKPYQAENDAKITLEVSYNNRGVAQCLLGRIRKDKNLFKQGVDDYQRAVDVDKGKENDQQRIAVINLKYARQDLENFDQRDKTLDLEF